jgi:hypothetical protein
LANARFRSCASAGTLGFMSMRVSLGPRLRAGCRFLPDAHCRHRSPSSLFLSCGGCHTLRCSQCADWGV